MLELRTLGGVDLLAPDVRDLRSVLHQPKRIALLAYLAVAGRKKFLRRDTLIALFWPEADAEHARGSLRSTLHRLRGPLGEGAIVTRGAEEVRIDGHVLRCDANCLRDAAAAGNHRSVLEEYRGAFLDGLYIADCAPEFEEWVEHERRLLHELAVDAAARLADREAAGGNVVEATAFARRALDMAPLDERGVRRLLSLLIQMGDHAAAVATYESFARRLRTHFQVEPSPETHALMARLRARFAAPPRRDAGGPSAARTPAGSPAAFAGDEALPGGESDAGASRAETRSVRVARPAPARRGPYIIAAAAVLLLSVGLTYARAHFAESSDAPAWRRLASDGPGPLARSHTVAVLDSAGRSILVFAGRAGEINVGDLWRLTDFDPGSRVRWTRVRTGGDPASAPRGRFMAAAAYNPRSDRMILFGGAFGYTTPCTDELWILKNVSGAAGPPTWEQIPRARDSMWPAPRAEHAVAYDAAANRLMLYGGHDCVAPVFKDYWVLRDADGSSGPPVWERLTPDTEAGQPREPRGHAMAFSAGSNRLVVFGGFDYSLSQFVNDAWILTGANGLGGRPAWRPLNVVGARPPGRIHSASGFDPSTNRLVVAFGTNAGGSLADAWVLIGADGAPQQSRWMELRPENRGPPPRQSPAAVFDPVSERLFVLGGVSLSGSLRDAWVLRNATGQ